MTARIAAATSPPWRASTRCMSPSLVCPSLAAPTLSLLAKVGQSRPPPAGHGSSPAVSEGGSWAGPVPAPAPAPRASVLPLCGRTLSGPAGTLLLLLLSPSPSLSLSPRFHLRKSSLQLSRNLLLSALPTGSTVLGSVFLGGARRGAGGWHGWSRWEEACRVLAWATQVLGSRSLPLLSYASLTGPCGPMAQPCGSKGGVAQRRLPAAQPAFCSQLVTQGPAAPSAGASSPRVCE